MAAHCSNLAWKIRRIAEPGALQSMGSQRVGNEQLSSEQLSIHNIVM